MEQKETLKPCPFCGSGRVQRVIDKGTHYVECSDCFARGGVSVPDMYSNEYKSNVEKLWNRRAK